MSRIFQVAGMAAITMTAIAAVALTVPGVAQESSPAIVAPVVINAATAASAQPNFVSVEVAQPLPVRAAPVEPVEPEAPANLPRHASSLRGMIDSIGYRAPEDANLRCVAAGVFYESKGEPLEGQLAVAHVIINRANSGRFASSECGVLTQRGQFSFVHGGVVPTPPSNGEWRTAVAIARIARDGDWASPVPGAMFFHAARLSPGWNRPRLARVGNHVFYR
jgi:hypothetical protein